MLHDGALTVPGCGKCSQPSKSVAIAIAAGILIVLGLFAGGIFHALKPGPKEVVRGTENLFTLIRVHQLIAFLSLIGIAVASTFALKFLKGNIDYRR